MLSITPDFTIADIQKDFKAFEERVKNDIVNGFTKTLHSLVDKARALQGVSAVAVAASLVALTACGSSSSGNGEEKKTGPTVATDSANALKAAGSARLQGTGVRIIRRSWQ